MSEICATCYPYHLPACNGIILVNTGIANFEDYFWKITDHLGNSYSGECTPTYGGSNAFMIDPLADPFVKGMFKSFSGTYVLEIVDPYDQVQPMTFGADTYQCIAFDFYDYSGDDIHSLIQ